MDELQGLTAQPLFARQPVFTSELAVFGHELLYRQGLASTQAVFSDLDAATLTVVAGAFEWQPGDFSGGQKILVNFGRRTILDKAPYALPPGRTVVELDEGTLLDEPLLLALAALKADGYLLAVNGFSARSDARPLLDLADMVIIDTLAHRDEEVPGLLAPLEARKIKAMAKKVEDEASFAKARKLGFALFQGYFFKRPEIVAGKNLASSELARLKLLRLTQSEHPDTDALGEAIRSDVSLSYRLLSYLNSPLHGQRMQSLSVSRAILVLGWRQLRYWLRVIALTDLSPPGKCEELSFLALTRARFFELTAGGLPGTEAAQTENLFTLGLFSLLDGMLQTPMSEILANLPLHQDVKQALLTGAGRFAAWLNMAQSLEQGDWAALEGALAELAVPAELAAESYQRAMEFAASVKRMGA